MNGDISRIPIQSLSTVVSLTDIISELPLPAPLQTNSNVESLLYDPKIHSDASQCLRSGNELLINSLSDAVANVCTNNIDFKDGFASDAINSNLLPAALTSALLKKAALFKQKRGFYRLSGHENLSSLVADSSDSYKPIDSWHSLDSINYNNDSRPYSNSMEDISCSPNKKKKKRKKKKHKHRDGDAGDTSGTGGESDATAPAAYGGTTPGKFEDSTLSPAPTYEVMKVNTDTKNLSLKIFKRVVSEPSSQQAVSTELAAALESKKDKKKKRAKDKDREHRLRREDQSIPLISVQSDQSSLLTNVALLNPSSTLADTNQDNILVYKADVHVSSNGPTALTPNDITSCPGFMPPVPNHSLQLAQQEPTNIDFSLMNNDGLFDTLNSTHIPYRQPLSKSTSSLPGTPASAFGGNISAPSSNFLPLSTCAPDTSCTVTSQNHVFTSESNLFDELLRNVDSAISLKPSGESSHEVMLPCPPAPSTICNMMDYASHFLQNDVLSSASPNFPSLGAVTTALCDNNASSRVSSQPLTSHHTPSFLVAPHLLDNSQVSASNVPEPNFDILGGILNTSGYVSIADSSPSAFVNNFDIAGLSTETVGHHVPMGLASYLSAPTQSVSQIQQNDVSQNREAPIRLETNLPPSITSTPQPWWKRKSGSAIGRRKRRKNELEGLQSWTVNYPTAGIGGSKSGTASERTKAVDERTWDDAIGSYSQAFGERAKRRKRIARQTGNFDPDYVFEHDKDYPNGGDSDAGSNDPNNTIDLTNDSNTTGDASQPANGPTAREMRSGTANRSYVGMDDDDDLGGSNYVSGNESSTTKRRKKADDDEPFEVRLKEPIEARFPHIRKAAEATRKRRERVSFGTVSSNSLRNQRHHLTDSTTAGESGGLKRFLNRLNNILEPIEETDLLRRFVSSKTTDDVQDRDLVGDEGVGFDPDNGHVPPEAIISSEDLAELCRDAAKLNAINIANQIPIDRLLSLMTLLLINVRDGASVLATLRPEEEADEHEMKLWREVAMERIMRSMNGGLTALFLMTSKEMPREVYVEDVIERTVHSVRFQLFNCIYPEFDPAYRVENSAKETQSSIKSRRARERDTQRPKIILHLYYKLVEIVSNLAKLVKMQRLTDSLVLALSSVGVSVFFVENVSELQLAALELVTAIFAQYEPHRKLIMEEILASLARLPSSKRNLRSYRLNSEDNIQMLTALALLLVQSVIVLPNCNSQVESSNIASEPTVCDPSINGPTDKKTDDEVLVTNSYDNALRTAHTFLLVFLRKSTVKGEDDYRMIFENFVNDLLLAVNKPEWPAAEVMLSLLGSLLVQQFNNKSLDQNVRVASVDYLGTVASTLRRDAVTSLLKENDIDTVIRDLLEGNKSDDDDDEDDEEGGSPKNHDVKTEDSQRIKREDNMPSPKNAGADNASLPHSETNCQINEGCKFSNTNGFNSNTANFVKKNECGDTKFNPPKNKRMNNVKVIDPITQLDRVQALRDAILDYLAAEEANPTAIYARKFYLAQWLNDCTKETERAHRLLVQKKSQDRVINGSETETLNITGGRLTESDQEFVLAVSERRRQHILAKIYESPENWRLRRRLWTNVTSTSSRGDRQKAQEDSDSTPLIFQGTLDYEDCCLVCRYLASLRPFSQSFDIYLSQICKLLSESSVAVRTKALRCLSAVVEADPNVLARVDIERAVHSRLLDTSTSVREAAVDLLGRFLGCRPELTAQYYPMLAERIRDKGVSVRKRVIRILRDICLEQPDFPKVPQICVQMIRRVNDEEGIKKLVNEVFQAMWFTPVRDRDAVKLLRKVMNITDVVAACKDTGYEWFEQFLRSLLKKEEGEKVKPVEKACTQIAECLVQNIMRLEEISSQSNQRLVACLATLHLLTKIRPELMVQYTMVLTPYLSIRCNEPSDAQVLHYVARILEATVPLMEHPSETFVAQLEEAMVRLTLRHGKMVLESSVACLGAVVNRVSKNYPLVRDCFTRFFNALQKFRAELSEDQERKIPPTIRPSILRALFTVGCLCKHFDANVFQLNSSTNVLDQVFETLMFFTEQVKSDIEMRKKALSGLGFLCTRHQELLCSNRLCKFYHDLLQAGSEITYVENNDSKATEHQLELQCIVLENLLNFFLEEEKRMLDADAKWKARQHQESLKEMGDIASGMGSSVAQAYLKDTLESFFSPSLNVRLTALSVITTILRQGLIHPVQTVPYLVATQTDIDPNIRVKADAQLQEIDHKFPGFLTMRATQGVNYSYRLQLVLFNSGQGHKDQHSNSTASKSGSSPTASNAQKMTGAANQSIRRSHRHKLNDTETGQTDEISSTHNNSKSSKSSDGLEVQQSNSDASENSFGAIRGTRDPFHDIPTALNSQLYSMVRVNRSQRRSLINGLISLFDDSQNQAPLSQLVYIADNLAHFPYQCQEEPLFVIHHIDLTVSMSGSGVLQNVREALFPELKAALENALIAQAKAEAEHRAQYEHQLQEELQVQHHASNEAVSRGDHVAAEGYALQIQQTMQKLANIAATHPPIIGGGSGMNELRSAALVGRDTVPHFDLGPLEEEEEDPVALFNRLSNSRQTTLPIIRDAIKTSRACVLLLTLKQFLKELYGITDGKIQRYSPTDAAKLWEKPLTRRTGVRFHPILCLKAAGMELAKQMHLERSTVPRSDTEGGPETTNINVDANCEEEYDGEMRSLVHDYLDFRKLILAIDPPGDDEPNLADELNTSIQSAGGIVANQDRPSVNLDIATQAVKNRPLRTIVPQSHNKSSDEENDSDDSNVGGASRLMLAQSAPARRRRPQAPALRNPVRTGLPKSSKKKRKRRRRFTMAASSSGEDSESGEESEASDPDY